MEYGVPKDNRTGILTFCFKRFRPDGQNPERSGRRHGSVLRSIVPFCLLIFLTSCDIINPDEPVPAYLYVEPFRLSVNTGAQGTASEKITEAWLSVDGSFLGAYALPAAIPVLADGEREISLQVGIRDNGISATPEIYPFYSVYETLLTLAPDRTDTIRPQTTYSDRARFPLIDDFDRGPTVFRDMRIGTTENELRSTETDPFEGKASGLIRLTRESPVVELASITRYTDLDANSPFVYLEVNYKSDVPVVFGVIGYQSLSPGTGTVLLEPGFRPSDEWNKIYFNLSPLIAIGNFDEYQLVFQAAIPRENGQLERDEAFIWLDNMKLVHF